MERNFLVAHALLRDAYEYKHMFPEAIAENEAAIVFTVSGDGSGSPNIDRSIAAAGLDPDQWHARIADLTHVYLG